MMLLDKMSKYLLLLVGILGVIIMYFGFFFLLFSGLNTSVIPWYALLAPWVCIFFGLPTRRQVSVIDWFKRRSFRRK